jgi:hypothetical protein
MDEKERPEANIVSDRDITRSRKPYEKPSFRSEAVFETMALACGKTSPVEFTCRFNRKNS